MAQLYVYADTHADAMSDVDQTLTDLVRDEIITSSHKQTLALAIEPLLPCAVKIGVRTPLSIVYCEAGGRRFRVGQRGQFMPGSWRANLRTKRFW
ncbi:MAG: hypothetical protein EHM48_04480 [Planctomycetaceae bacterium]|nr:MAG: hypothetical protein EHM48_04480 [Planctomycetaceae bacterium]